MIKLIVCFAQDLLKRERETKTEHWLRRFCVSQCRTLYGIVIDVAESLRIRFAFLVKFRDEGNKYEKFTLLIKRNLLTMFEMLFMITDRPF